MNHPIEPLESNNPKQLIKEIYKIVEYKINIKKTHNYTWGIQTLHEHLSRLFKGWRCGISLVLSNKKQNNQTGGQGQSWLPRNQNEQGCPYRYFMT